MNFRNYFAHAIRRDTYVVVVLVAPKQVEMFLRLWSLTELFKKAHPGATTSCCGEAVLPEVQVSRDKV